MVRKKGDCDAEVFYVNPKSGPRDVTMSTHTNIKMPAVLMQKYS